MINIDGKKYGIFDHREAMELIYFGNDQFDDVISASDLKLTTLLKRR